MVDLVLVMSADKRSNSMISQPVNQPDSGAVKIHNRAITKLLSVHVQTIVFMHKRKPLAPLTTDVAQSISRVSSSEGDLRGDPVVTSTLLAVETPNSNFPISGIMYSSDISIHYRIRVSVLGHYHPLQDQGECVRSLSSTTGSG